MLSFEKVILHNFGSYGHAEVELSNKGFCLVSGTNTYKKDNAISNGSGKSFLWSGICFALTGETVSGLKTNLKNINIDEDSCYVKLFFNFNGDSFEITRYINPKSDLSIIKNGIDVSGKGIRESEKKLGELLPSIDKNYLTSSIILGQGMPNKFSSFSPSGRKELLEKLTKSDFMIEDIRTRVTGRLQVLNTSIRECDDSILIKTTQLSNYQKTLLNTQAEINSRIKPDFEAQINNFSTQLNSLQQDINTKTEQANNAETEENKLNTELVKILETNAKDLDSEKEAYEAVYTEYLTEKTRLESELKSINKTIASLKAVKDTCPTCGQKLPGATKPDTTEQEKEAVRLTESLSKATTKLNDCTTKHFNYQNQIKAKYDATITELKTKVAAAKREKESKLREVTDLTRSQTVIRDQITKLNYEKENWDNKQTQLNQIIETTTQEVNKLSEELTKLSEQKHKLGEHLAVVKKMETLLKRDFRGYLLSNIIKYVDLKAKEFSEVVFGTKDLSIYLDGNALDISYCGKMFDNLSGGEKQRVDVILQFAIRNMLSKYLNESSNIIVLDEVTDFLDKKSCAAVLQLIESELNTVESVFIVSHHAAELEIPVDSELKIIKNEYGISEIN